MGNLSVAVWVGYPDKLVPMRTEFGGEPVTGGTLPALIWKEFVSRHEKSKEDSSEEVSFDSAPYLGAVPMWVVKRGGKWMRDNQYCRGSKLIAATIVSITTAANASAAGPAVMVARPCSCTRPTRIAIT